MPGPGAGLAVLLRPLTLGGAAADPVTCVGVAPGTLVTGHTSGTVRTHSWPAPAAAPPQLIKELRVAGRGESVTVVRAENSAVCAGTSSGEVVVVLPGHRVLRCALGQPVSCAAWTQRDSELCVGGAGGAVALVSLARRDITQILDLGSRVVQIEAAAEGGLLVSSLAASVLVNTHRKTFRQLGARPRCGQFGACEASEPGVVWAARPGCRVWRVEAGTGAVTSTQQYKPSLEAAEASTRVRVISASAGHTPASAPEHGFSLLTPVPGTGLTLTHSARALYLLDLAASEVAAWWSVPEGEGELVEAHALDPGTLVTLSSTGAVTQHQFGPLASLLEHGLATVGARRLQQHLEAESPTALARLYCGLLSPASSCVSEDSREAVARMLQEMLSLDPHTDGGHLVSRSLPFHASADVDWGSRKRTNSEPTNNLIPETFHLKEAEDECDDDTRDVTKDEIDGEAADEETFPLEFSLADIRFDDSVAQTVDKLRRQNIDFDDTELVNKSQILNEMIISAQNIIEESDDNVTKHISRLSLQLRKLLIHHFNECNEHETESEMLVNLTSTQKNILNSCFTRIFSDDLYRDICFNPLKDVLEEHHQQTLSFSAAQRVRMFEQQELEQDRLLASVLRHLLDLVDPDPVLRSLRAPHFLALRQLLRHQHRRRPVLAPMALDQIDESNVYEAVNLISSYRALAPCDVLRYAEHVSQWDAACSVHLLQNFALELPPVCLLYFPLAYYDNLMQAVKTRNADDPALNEAVNVEFATVLVKCLSLHLPAWAEAWAEVFRTHYSLATTVFEAFKTANETRLAKVANLVGAHKSPEAVETAALGTFLTSHFCSRGEDAATLCLQTSDMAGLARLATQDPAVALENLPIMVELGDIELLTASGLVASHPEEVASHLVSVYRGQAAPSCPLSWPALLEAVLEAAGPDTARSLVTRAAQADCLPPGSLARGFYCRLLVKSIIRS